MNEQRNLWIAILLSVAILFVSNHYFPYAKVMPKALTKTETKSPEIAAQIEQKPLSRDDALNLSTRVTLEGPQVRHTIALKGARLDDMVLKNYTQTIDDNSPLVTLLSPQGSPQSYYSAFGWIGEAGQNFPTEETLWSLDSKNPSRDNQVNLFWDNGQGLTFNRSYVIDDQYMVTINQKITNNTGAPITAYPYSKIVRHTPPKSAGFAILHEGPLGVLGNKLTELTYEKLQKKGTVEHISDKSWLGITDKYWLTALVPDQKASTTTKFRYNEASKTYQADNLLTAKVIKDGDSTDIVTHFFAGAKEVSVIEDYESKLNINKFSLSIDFGWLYFITKPLFHLLDFIQSLVGNFAITILILTVLIKATLFPMAYKSVRSMANLKSVGPDIQKLKERYSHDKMRLNEELMALYKKKNINPASGCLPILIQIPIFFALYKVFFITIEMRHTPFFGLFQDMSASDPTSIINLFGLLNFEPFFNLGILPIIMGLTMFIQQSLSTSKPTDPQQAQQAQMMKFMPWVVMLLVKNFPAGLIIYWCWSNTLSILQQILITHLTNRSKRKV
jgi:YidC/Oxa1 family membrane protein insertase